MASMDLICLYLLLEVQALYLRHDESIAPMFVFIVAWVYRIGSTRCRRDRKFYEITKIPPCVRRDFF